MSERAHPYDLVFASPEFEETQFPGIRDEAAARGVDARDQQRFIMLESVGELMRSLLPADAVLPATTQFAAIVTHVYHYWLAGKHTFSVSESSLRALLGAEQAAGSGDATSPVPAGYLQLPRNLVFGRVEETAHAEAIDGFFFILSGENDTGAQSYDRLDVMLVLGLVPNRPGFSVIRVGTELAEGGWCQFVDVSAREGGADFENVLPGGEGRLFAVTNELEVLKLAARCFSDAFAAFGK